MVLHACNEETGELRLLAGSDKGTLYAVVALRRRPPLDRRARRADARSPESHHAGVIAVAYPRDSSDVFATASADGTVRVWDVNTYRVLSQGRRARCP